jgi:hypothetical protein
LPYQAGLLDGAAGVLPTGVAARAALVVGYRAGRHISRLLARLVGHRRFGVAVRGCQVGDGRRRRQGDGDEEEEDEVKAAKMSGHGRPTAAPAAIYPPTRERSFYVTDRWGNDLCFVEEGTLYT